MLAIAHYRNLELELAQKVTYLEALMNDPVLKQELAFDAALEDFLAQHAMNKQKLQVFLGADPTLDFYKKPVAAKKPKSKRETRHTEPAMTFVNPHTNEVLTIKRLSHGTYKQWVAEHGEATVQSWLQA